MTSTTSVWNVSMRSGAAALRLLAAGCCLIAIALSACAGTPEATRARPKPRATCLVLSVGGVDGIAHLGAIESLRAHQVSVSSVVGNSVGALVGVLYASAPLEDTTVRFRVFMSRYASATRAEAEDRAVGGGLLGLLAFGPLGALAGASMGASSMNELDHERIVTVLNDYLGTASIEDFRVPFQTSYFERQQRSAQFVSVQNGNAAHAVGASMANPFIFRDLDVRTTVALDPGIDRVAATPIEQACIAFPNTQILAVNVTGEPAFVSTHTRCPVFEVRVSRLANGVDARFGDPAAFEELRDYGKRSMDAWLASSDGARFLTSAIRQHNMVQKTPPPTHFE